MRSNQNNISTVNGNGALARRNNSDQVSFLSPLGASLALFDDINPILVTSPFQLMDRMQKDMDHLFSQMTGLPGKATRPNGLPYSEGRDGFFSPAVDVSETKNEYRIDLDLPGVTQDSVDVRILESTLIIHAEARQEETTESQQPLSENSAESNGNGQSAAGAAANQTQNPQRRYHYRERRWGRFERAFNLPPDADEQSIEANFSSGVLTLTIPKKVVQPAQPQGRRIAVGSSSTDSGTLVANEK